MAKITKKSKNAVMDGVLAAAGGAATKLVDMAIEQIAPDKADDGLIKAAAYGVAGFAVAKFAPAQYSAAGLGMLGVAGYVAANELMDEPGVNGIMNRQQKTIKSKMQMLKNRLQAGKNAGARKLANPGRFDSANASGRATGRTNSSTSYEDNLRILAMGEASNC